MVNRLSALFELQLLDDLLDELEELRGDLPLAVNELKSQIDTFKSQVEVKEEEKKESQKKRQANEAEVEKLTESLTKFKAQLYQVRNNKEYDALTKEIDHSEERITTLDNESLALEDLVEKLKMDIEEIEPQLEKYNAELKEKEAELKKIVKANEREEVKIQEKREALAEKVRKPDYNTYMRIRKALGGKAVATINRTACSGCHSVVPPQRQLEIKQNQKIYSCESCGRILVSPNIADDAKEK